MKDYSIKNTSCHRNREEIDLHTSESNILSQKTEVWVEFISGMLHLAMAQLYNVDESTIYSTGVPECMLGIVSSLFKHCSLIKR